MLQHCIHCELVNCTFQFHKRGQPFVGGDDETVFRRDARQRSKLCAYDRRWLRPAHAESGFAESASNEAPFGFDE